MNKMKKLTIARGIFVFIVFVSLGVIVVTEKSGSLLIPKIQDKMNNYLETNFKDALNEFKQNEVNYKNATYKLKITSKVNDNHYFYIISSNNKITDTYKEDYLEGKNLLTHIQTELKKEIKNKSNISCDVEIISKLNKFTTKVQERIISEDNLINLKFYTIKKELLITNWNPKEISNSISNTISNFTKYEITPRNYTITITNRADITESIEISNLTEEFLNLSSKEKIINYILNDENNTELKQKKIRYKYLN